MFLRVIKSNRFSQANGERERERERERESTSLDEHILHLISDSLFIFLVSKLISKSVLHLTVYTQVSHKYSFGV